jgi:succinate dehydrogenase / fumarate reductase flavoprotein subunit
MVFHCKAIILATGGIGRSFKITSNSWECTGDGVSLAYNAGAKLVDMEFVQFHPTGMVWPVGVMGLLVTEGVSGEGGILYNNQKRRFMFDDIPDLYKNQTADNEEEGWRYTQGDKNARRPPELLTRDHVARCIMREIKAGRGSPHGGVYLDISWIHAKIKNSAEHIRKKLPSMYHQFMKLANVDIAHEPMEVGPTTHYFMGGIKVDADTQMSSVQGLFAAGECSAGLHGANRLGGNSLSDLLVFGKRAGEHAARFAKDHGAGALMENEVQAIIAKALSPLSRAGASKEQPFSVLADLQESMQALVGIVRVENEMNKALDNIEVLRKRTETIGCIGGREYNPGWQTALDLPHQLLVSEAITRAGIERKESRGAHFRDDYPEKKQEFASVNIAIEKDAHGRMSVMREPVTAMPLELKTIIEEMK